MNLNDYAKECHSAASRWWIDLNTGKRLIRNKGELIALIHSELSEALEGVRKNLQDDKLPQYKMEEVEMVDALIRIFDYCGAYNININEIYIAKMNYNSTREDHQIEDRQQPNGKKF